MEKSRTILIILVAAMAGLVMIRGVLARAVIVYEAKAVAGLPLEIRRLEVDLFRPRVAAGGIRVFNPPGFPDKVMADLPALAVDYDPPGFFRGQAHLRELRIDLREFVVVKNREGNVNLDSIASVRKAKESKARKPAKPSSLRIDTLHLKIGRVIYKDYSGGGDPVVREFRIDLDEEYRSITDPTSLGSLIVARALFNTTIASLARFDLGAVDDQVRAILKDPLGTAGRLGSDTWDAAAGIVGDTLDRFKKVIK